MEGAFLSGQVSLVAALVRVDALRPSPERHAASAFFVVCLRRRALGLRVEGLVQGYFVGSPPCGRLKGQERQALASRVVDAHASYVPAGKSASPALFNISI